MKRIQAEPYLCLAAALVLMFCCHEICPAAEPGFLVEDNLRFTLPVPENSSNAVSFFVYSKEGTITAATVRVREIKDPNGLSLAEDKIIVSLESNVVTPEGTRVTLRPDATLFLYSGEYRINLLIEGLTEGGQPARSLATVTINHPAAELNLEELKNQTIELKRDWPGGEAASTYKIYLQETSGKAEIRNLKLIPQVQSIYVEDSKELVPGQLSVKPVFVNSSGQPSSENPGQWVLEVTVSGIEKTGSFTSQLLLNSPSFAGTKIIPFRINVNDRWGYALFIIMLGVLGAFLINFLAQNWKPRQENSYKITQLRGRADSYLQRVEDSEKKTKLWAILDDLTDAEDKNEQGRTTEARTQLEQIEKELNDFRKAEVKEQAALYDELSKLKAQVERYCHDLEGITQEESDKLRALADDLGSGAVETFLSQDRVDQAKRQLQDYQSKFDDFKKERLEKDLQSLEQQLEQLGDIPAAHEDEKKEIETKIENARKLIREAKIDEARDILDQIEQTIKALDKKLAKGAGLKAATPRNRLLTKTQEEAPPLGLTGIRVAEPPEERTTDDEVHFSIDDPEGVIQSGDTLRWYFGDGKVVEPGQRTIAHRFTKQGKYGVKVDIKRGQEIIRPLSLTITIIPGRTDLALEEIRRRIKKSDLLISGIALILAAFTGLLHLYVDKPFGSLSDYLLAFLWGFGIDNGVRGFASVLKKVTGQEG